MIDREDLPYIKNILSLNNKEVNLDLIHNVLTALKEDDQLSFYTSLLDRTELNQDFLHNTLQAIKDNPHLEKDIFDSFSNNQIASKSKLIKVIESLDVLNNNEILNKEKEIVIFGSWYGSILIPKLADYVKRITALDLNKEVLSVAKNKLFNNYDNIDYIASDVFDEPLKRYHDASLFINTSCEHMLPMKDWPFWYKFNAYFVFQSNNMDYIEDHSNCVFSLEEFKSQLPENATVLFEDEIQDTRGTRYMLVGKVRRTI